MKALILALLTAATAVAHAQTLDVFETHGNTHYAMVPTDKAQDTDYIGRAAYKFCADQNKGSCHIKVWSDSLDKPTGQPHHTRYNDNQLADYTHGPMGVSATLFNCKIVKSASRCYQR
ncbi:hypothetical protein HNP48_005803 [Acidovorax soli]|uniref:DUF4189 domain-containing protein n=1 Tax=Acidovorax soli TaxID=592050 RepID=A0A7X0UC65_9BURK|nr:hypothetical protein [Acidovorax soli]MBB6563086.1 hypothetical protein [Acidovorax soli]